MSEEAKASTSQHAPPRSAAEEDAVRETIWNIPNQLTIARIFLSIVFFVILALETHGAFGAGQIKPALNISAFLFILAVITDFLDGYLARKWKLTSTFGRIADPFADKIVVCGGFVMLTGIAGELVEPWYPVVIMFREFLISGLRSFLESRGVAFGASMSGKLKMVFQSITIPLVLFYEANLASARSTGSWIADTIYWLTVAALGLTLIFTVASSVGYVQRAVQLLRGTKLGPPR